MTAALMDGDGWGDWVVDFFGGGELELPSRGIGETGTTRQERDTRNVRLYKKSVDFA